MTEAAHAIADAMCEAQTIIDEHLIGSLYTPRQVVEKLRAILEDTLTYEVSDEALEAAAGTEGSPSPAISLNFTSFHLHCC